MLAKPFDWDACQFPVNALDMHYRSFQKQVLPVCLKKKVGALGMKGFGGRDGIARGAGLTADARPGPGPRRRPRRRAPRPRPPLAVAAAVAYLYGKT